MQAQIAQFLQNQKAEQLTMPAINGKNIANNNQTPVGDSKNENGKKGKKGDIKIAR